MTAEPSLLNILASTLSGCERRVVSVVENTRPPTFKVMILVCSPFMFGHRRPDCARPNAALKECCDKK